MKSDESLDPLPLNAAAVDGPKPEEDQPPDSIDWSPDDVVEIPFPAPSDSGTRGYAVEIFGDERGGQAPKLPPLPVGNQDE